MDGTLTELLHRHTFLSSMPFLWRWFELLSKIGEVSVFVLCGGATFTLYCLLICWYYHSMPRTIYFCMVFKVGLCFKHSTSYTIFYLTRLAQIIDYAWKTILTQSPQEKWRVQEGGGSTWQLQHARVLEAQASSEGIKLICQGASERGLQRLWWRLHWS